MRIDLHLGVHKTATTHLQRYWLTCGQVAGATAVAPSLTEVRMHLTPVCNPPSVKSAGGDEAERRRQAATHWLQDWCSRAPALVLSDENIIGSSARLFAQRALYANVSGRLQRLAEMLDGHEVRIWIAVREYGAFLRSAYCEMLRHGPYRPFRQVYGPMDLERRGWEHVVQEIQQVFPAARLVCWRYESLNDLRPSITAALFGLKRAAMPPLDDRRDRQSLSQLAVELLDDIHRRVGAEEATRVHASVERVVSGHGLAHFDPWTDAERSEFKERYERSLSALQGLPGLSWLG
ncbi:hypothetical protein AACH06_20270 [Ideonella sp. DXS29W]|uniref:Sulfotransferase n=1 Tax=Ideonella lacteola TaxID=2984193 RepID=A0ABU9BT70_9BURK